MKERGTFFPGRICSSKKTIRIAIILDPGQKIDPFMLEGIILGE
jgi:hypothetical protein